MEAEKADNAFLKSEDEIQWDFSEKFEKSMTQIIKKNNHIKFSTRRKIRKGLLAAIVATVVMFTGLMSVSATRIPFIEFIKKQFPKYNEITLSEESTPPVDTMEKEYTLTYVPEDFKISTYEADEFGVFSVWTNDDNCEIVFSQGILDTNLSIDTEHNYREITINGHEAYLNHYEFNSSLKWTDGSYWFILSVPDFLSDDIITMAENIVEKN